jgi:hypothetical protein
MRAGAGKDMAANSIRHAKATAARSHPKSFARHFNATKRTVRGFAVAAQKLREAAAVCRRVEV